LTPRGGADRIDGVQDGLLRVRVAAPPVDGAANVSLVRLLARELGVPPTAVRIAAGESARTKRIVLDGVSAEALRARWPGLTV
jgi:hypothetical protein